MAAKRDEEIRAQATRDEAARQIEAAGKSSGERADELVARLAAEQEARGAIDLETINRFKALTAPCLVCGKMPTGLAFGITPDLAVCQDDFANNPDDSQAALEAAARGERPKRKRGGR